MNEIIYLEPDDDITAVIGRLKEITPQTVSLVIPRGGNIAQSVVNLKLLKREVEKIGKQVSLVTNDKISRNLSSQVGITVYSSVHEAKNARPAEAIAVGTAVPFSNQLKINRYNKEDDELSQKEENLALESAAPKPIEDAKAKEPIASTTKPITEEAQHHPISNIPQRHPRGQNIRRGIPEQNVPVGSRFRSKNVSSRKKPLIIIVSSFIVLALLLSIIFLPKAEASIILKTENVADASTITLDKNIKENDQKTLSVPGTQVSADEELTKEFPATGSKNVGTKATGEVTFYNYWDINPQTIAAGTTLSASGKNFVTNAAITIPGANVTLQQGVTKKDPGTAKVTITAADAGDDYNLPPSKFLVTAFSGNQKDEIYAQSEAALSGGTTKKVTVVSDDDIAKAKDATKAELNQKITDKISAQISKDNKKIIASSLAVTEKSNESSKKSGDEASNFTYKISAMGNAIAFSETDVRNIIVQKITSDLGSDQMVVNPEKADISYVLKESKPDEGKIIINTNFVGKKGKKYNADDIKKQITNKKYGTALSTIQGLAEVEKAELIVSPKFFPRTPIISSRVKVNFDYIK